MKTPSAAHLWRAVEDRLFPALRPRPFQRLLYYHLLRHTHLNRRRTLRCTKGELARALSVSPSTVRDHLRALVRDGCLRILERGDSGLRIEVFLPHEIPASKLPPPPPHTPARRAVSCPLKDPQVRAAIFRRERGRCFYCLRPLRLSSSRRSPAARHALVPNAAEGRSAAGLPVPTSNLRPPTSGLPLATASFELDHVVPLSRSADDSPSNVVACCHDCNSAKAESSAADFLKMLFRNGVFSRTELRSRLSALNSLRA